MVIIIITNLNHSSITLVETLVRCCRKTTLRLGLSALTVGGYNAKVSEPHFQGI